MPSQCIDQRSQHHFHSLDKRFAVTTAGCVRNGSFKVVNDRQQVLDDALFGKTDRVISIAGCASLVILEFGGLPQESVIVVFCLDFLVFELFPQSRDFGFQAGLESEIAALREQLENKEIEAKNNYDRFLRQAAEFENYKRRTSRDRDDAIRFAKESMIKDLLPIIDNLERAVAHA